MSKKKTKLTVKEENIALSKELLKKVFDRFVILQVVGTLIGGTTNTIIHGVSPAIIMSFLTIIFDILVALYVKRKDKPETGAWILNSVHGFLLFPVIIAVSGIPSLSYLVIMIVSFAYIATPRNRAKCIFWVLIYYTGMLALFRLRFPVWMRYSEGEFLTAITTFYIVCVSVLILELVFLNQYVIFTEEIREQSKAKSEFLARMSHEIRTPINGIIGMNEMIMRECEDEDVVRYAGNARNSGKVLLSIVNDILDISKVESGKMEIIPSEYYLKNVLSELAIMIIPRANNKSLSVIWNINESIPSKLYGDEIKIIQVITNLLTNAVKYTERGTVTINIDGKERDDAFDLYVSVKDTGRGIGKEDQKKVFSAFERFDSDFTRSIEGTGLGLNITHKMLGLMGSELKLESEYGKGSNFYFTVEQKIVDRTPIGPITPETLTASDYQKKTAVFTAPSARVLCVDDNKMNREVFVSLMKRTEIEVLCAQSGKEALSFLQTEKFDMVFLDHMMPELDGVETLGIIRENHLCDGTPIIALTANAITGAKEEYLGYGFDGFLSKPINAMQLEEMIIEYLPDEKVVIKEVDTEENNKQIKRLNTIDFPEIDGFDWQYARLFYNSDEILWSVFNQFRDTINDMISEIREAYANIEVVESRNLLRIKVHAVKSLCKSVGQLDLFELAKLSETALKENNVGKAHLFVPILLEELDKCSFIISKFNNEEALVDKEKYSVEVLLKQINELTGCMDELDFGRADEIIEDMCKYSYDEEVNAIINDIKKAELNLDTDSVMDLCEKLQKIIFV